jgi:hypothetical protein
MCQVVRCARPADWACHRPRTGTLIGYSCQQHLGALAQRHAAFHYGLVIKAVGELPDGLVPGA